jgi:hypothetical protein
MGASYIAEVVVPFIGISTLRDFGVLQGAVNKRIAPAYMPVTAFAYIAFYLKQHQPSGARLLEHPDWNDIPDWSYTIGLYASCGHPEIVVFELERDFVHTLLWDLAGSIQAGNRFEPGQLFDDVLPSFEGQTFMFERVSPGSIPALFGWGSWFYKYEEFPVLQYLWPDRNGPFMWEDASAESSAMHSRY